MITNTKRTFILGDDWFYFKIYTGASVADSILNERIAPLTSDWLNKEYINKWFFIRYYDPKFHLRIRVQITNQSYLQLIIKDLNLSLSSLVNQRFIWSLQTDSYVRELERYGFGLIEEAENIFFHDSVTALTAINYFEKNNGEEPRWKIGICIIDNYLNLFRIDIHQKMELMEKYIEIFRNEMNYNKSLRNQLNEKFRTLKSEIEILLQPGKKPHFLLNTISRHNISLKGSVDKIEQTVASPILGELIFSYCHMSLNRLYQTESRKNEFVSYHLLHNYYKSKIAREKYASINK